MVNRLFTLHATYDRSESGIMSADETVLRRFGCEHHRAARIKPRLTLRKPDGVLIATMDTWASEWVEAGR